MNTPAANLPRLLSRRLAFTLVEMLVVLAIIGILAALLLPVIVHAKDRAIRSIDIGNLKQIITATHFYAADNADFLPWSNWGVPLDRPGWLYKTLAADSGANRFKAETGLFWPVLLNEKLYWCPQDKPAHPMFKYRAQQSSSYVMNGAVNGYHRERYPCLRLAQFEPEDVIFWETDEQEPGFFNDGASRPDEGVSARHDAGALCAAFAGAVQYVKFTDWYHDAMSTNKTRLWCYPEAVNGR